MVHALVNDVRQLDYQDYQDTLEASIMTNTSALTKACRSYALFTSVSSAIWAVYHPSWWPHLPLLCPLPYPRHWDNPMGTVSYDFSACSDNRALLIPRLQTKTPSPYERVVLQMVADGM